MLLVGFGCMVTTGGMAPQNAPRGDIKDADANTAGLKRSYHAGHQDPKQLPSPPVPFARSHQQRIGTMAARTFRQRARFLLPPSSQRVRV